MPLQPQRNSEVVRIVRVAVAKKKKSLPTQSSVMRVPKKKNKKRITTHTSARFRDHGKNRFSTGDD